MTFPFRLVWHWGKGPPGLSRHKAHPRAGWGLSLSLQSWAEQRSAHQGQKLNHSKAGK